MKALQTFGARQKGQASTARRRICAKQPTCSEWVHGSVTASCAWTCSKHTPHVPTTRRCHRRLRAHERRSFFLDVAVVIFYALIDFLDTAP